MAGQYDTVFEVVQKLDARLEDPFHWRKPARIFVDSVSDLFHGGVPDEFINLVFLTMGNSPQHTFIILTKRPERMRKYINNPERMNMVNARICRLCGWIGGHSRMYGWG